MKLNDVAIVGSTTILPILVSDMIKIFKFFKLVDEKGY